MSISQPAVYACSGFAIFAFFQSIAIGRNYQESIQLHQKLSRRLEQSKAALELQRKEFELNLHDSLGGALTDLKIMVERCLEQNQQAGFNKHTSNQQLAHILDRIESTNHQLREQLLFMEDLELTIKEPIVGLHMQLLRRYANAKRELEFKIETHARAAIVSTIQDEPLRMEFVQLVRELCTNDLKYGTGLSHWHIDFKPLDQTLVVLQRNRVANTKKEPTSFDSGHRRSIASRAAKIGGSLKIDHNAENCSVQLILSVTHSGPA